MTVEFGQDGGRFTRNSPWRASPRRLSTVSPPLAWGKAGQDVVDVGTGSGTLARGFALRGCRAVGVDPAPGNARQGAKAGLQKPVCRWSTGWRGQRRTGLERSSYDVFSAGQCWHWFDRPSAAAEARRLLRAGGAIVICHFDWLPLPASVAEATEAVILCHNPQWGGAGGSGMYPRWAADVAGAGFSGIETFSYDVDVTYTHEAWRGRIRASAGVAASLSPEAVRDFDADHTGVLAERFPDDTLHVPHRV